MLELHRSFPIDSYNQDGLVSVHNHDFMRAEDFQAAYQRGVVATKQDYMWHWRVHIGLWAARTALGLPGDFVECGVNSGFMSSSIMKYLDWNKQNRRFYLLDTFRGLDPRFVSDRERTAGILEKNRSLLDTGFYVTTSGPVRENFSEWSNVEIIEGAIPETLTLVAADTIAFLHIDLNCAPPEVAALNHFWDRLARGAIVLLDDYAYAGYGAQKDAIDEVAAQKNVSVVSLPTGQGLLIRY